MKITEEQVTLLVDLTTVIELNLGYKIGYTHPCGSFTSPEDDFVIFDTLTEEDAGYLGLEGGGKPQLVAREDYERRQAGIGVQEGPNQFCLHDDKVEDLLKEINEALMSGRIFFDPVLEKKIGYKTFRIAKRADGCFNVRVMSETRESGCTQTLEELQRLSQYDSEKQQALELIKKEWPEAF